MLIHHDFIHTSIFFRWSLVSLLNRTKGQLKFLPRGEELALERVVRCFPCKAANNHCNANCQCCWRSCNEGTKRPAAGHGLKTIKRPAGRYFSIFLFEIQNIYTKMFYFYLQSSSASMQPKISNWLLFAIQPSKRLRLGNFSMTRPDTVLR